MEEYLQLIYCRYSSMIFFVLLTTYPLPPRFFTFSVMDTSSNASLLFVAGIMVTNQPISVPFVSVCDCLISAVPVFPRRSTPSMFAACHVPEGSLITCRIASFTVFTACLVNIVSFNTCFFDPFSLTRYGFSILPLLENAV